jgi:hypothetical protein
MFNDREYFEVNREERHFGNLLIASIIYDEKFRDYLFTLINKRINKINYLQGNFDIYSETAILRDYFNIDKRLIEKYQVFWTQKGYLWNPGHWTEKNSIKKIKQIQIDEKIPNDNLCRIAWAFNAKPDLLLISNDNCLIIELKVESGIGKKDNGYNQMETQQDIIELVKISVPFFHNKQFEKIMLTKEMDKKNISWNELLEHFNNELVKKHFKRIWLYTEIKIRAELRITGLFTLRRQ